MNAVAIPPLTELSVEEAIRLSAIDIPTFGQIWFPKTFRQKSPAMHYHMSQVFEKPGNRLVGMKVFREGAKTTIGRTYLAKRIAFCISRTCMLVNINAPKAEQSLRWLKRQVLHNERFAKAFKLRQGSKWTDAWSSFINARDEEVHVVAMGITSGLRGFNIDDYRPDFILPDDISDAENTATEEQRIKQDERFFAQLVRSLVPYSENPLAQLALLQTPINSFDLISCAEKDPQFTVVSYSCFGPDGQSAWPERWSTEALLRDKQGYINRNKLSIWLAEMEVTLTSAETQALRRVWLKYWSVLPGEGRVVIVLDPASSEKADADFFAIVALLFWREKVFVLEYSLQRGMMPDAACAVVFDYAARYNSRDVVVETVAYQKIMKWYLEKEVQSRRVWLNVHEYNDGRRKDDRIIQGITSVAPYGNLFIREGMMEIEELFELYGPGYGGKVDLIDAISVGICWHLGRGYASVADDVEGEFRRLREEDEQTDLDSRGNFQGAP